MYAVSVNNVNGQRFYAGNTFTSREQVMPALTNLAMSVPNVKYGTVHHINGQFLEDCVFCPLPTGGWELHEHIKYTDNRLSAKVLWIMDILSLVVGLGIGWVATLMWFSLKG